MLSFFERHYCYSSKALNIKPVYAQIILYLFLFHYLTLPLELRQLFLQASPPQRCQENVILPQLFTRCTLSTPSSFIAIRFISLFFLKLHHVLSSAIQQEPCTPGEQRSKKVGKQVTNTFCLLPYEHIIPALPP